MSTVKIALDAGHGLNTPGKQTPDGIKEWTLNDKVRDKVVACCQNMMLKSYIQITMKAPLMKVFQAELINMQVQVLRLLYPFIIMPLQVIGTVQQGLKFIPTKTHGKRHTACNSDL